MFLSPKSLEWSHTSSQTDSLKKKAVFYKAVVFFNKRRPQKRNISVVILMSLEMRAKQKTLN